MIQIHGLSLPLLFVDIFHLYREKELAQHLHQKHIKQPLIVSRMKGASL